MSSLVNLRYMSPASSRMRAFVSALTLLASLTFAQSTNAQDQSSPVEIIDSSPQIDESSVQSNDSSVQIKDGGVEQGTLKELLAPLSAGVVRIRNRDRLCCLGTIVADGLVVTKRSELSGSLTCVTANGAEVAGVVVASDQADDLALLRMMQPAPKSEKSAQAVKFAGGANVDSGDVLFSVGPHVDPLSVGVATVAPQQLPVAQPVCRDCVDLGVTVSARTDQADLKTARPGGEWFEVQKIYGTKVKRVYPRTVGERVGILQGDLLVSVNQQWVPNAATLRSIGSRVRVGQLLDVIVVRDGALKQLSMKIDHFSRRVYHDRWGGGPFSERRFGFNATIVHDSLLEPSQCGAPLVNLKGDVVGLNISRSMRVATLAVPADRVQAFVNRFKHLAIVSSP